MTNQPMWRLLPTVTFRWETVTVPATPISTTRTLNSSEPSGGLGKGPGQLDCPHGLWVDTRSDTAVLVVADRSNQRLLRFTLDGKHIDFILGTSKLALPLP